MRGMHQPIKLKGVPSYRFVLYVLEKFAILSVSPVVRVLILAFF